MDDIFLIWPRGTEKLMDCWIAQTIFENTDSENKNGGWVGREQGCYATFLPHSNILFFVDQCWANLNMLMSQKEQKILSPRAPLDCNTQLMKF